MSFQTEIWSHDLPAGIVAILTTTVRYRQFRLPGITVSINHTNSSRNSRFRILPDGFRGNSFLKIDSLGTLKAANLRLQCATTTSDVNSASSFCTIIATGTSPHLESCLPTTATSETSGNSRIILSTSDEAIFCPQK